MLERGERLVTITGAPGRGKSTLARQVAERWATDAGPVVTVDLADAVDAPGVAAALAAALGSAPRAAIENDALRSAAQALAARGPVVVVLDGFEQLVPLALVSVHRWRSLAPLAQFLVTSEAPLGIPDEVVFELAPAPASVDGEGAVAFSSLTEAERAVLAQCTVFRAAPGEDAARAVLTAPGASAPIDELLQALRDHALLGSPGRSFLHRRVRALAAKELPDLAARSLRDRHLRYFAETADAWRAAPPAARARWRAEAARVHDDIAAALMHALGPDAGPEGPALALPLAWALEAAPPLRLPLEEQLAWLDRALAGVDADPTLAAALPSLLADVLALRARARRRAGQLVGAASDLERARLLIEGTVDPGCQGRVWHGLGRVRILEDRDDDADRALARALPLHVADGDRRHESMTLSARSLIRLRQGDDAGAAAHADQALAAAHAHGDARLEAESLLFVALVHQHRGALGPAGAAFEAARRAAEAAGDTGLSATCRIHGALVLLEQGELEASRAALEATEPVVNDFDPRAEGLLASHLATVRTLQGELVDAGWLFGRAERLLQAIDVALLPAVVGPQRGLLDMARAGRARAAGDPEGAQMFERRAAQRLATARTAPRSDDGSRGASPADTTRVVVCRMLAAALPQA